MSGPLIINDSNYREFINPVVNGEVKMQGLIPRNYSIHPRGCYGAAQAINFPTIPRSEWSDRIKEKVAMKSQLSDIRMRGNNGSPIPSLDQNGKGYCWAHSTTQAVMMLRADMGQPYVPLSAYAVACVIKNYRDEGGWGALSLDFATNRGIPSQEFWPQQSMDRANDNPNTWKNAALHKVGEGFVDLAVAAYDRTLSFEQVATCLLCNVPVVGDFNWWGHSVCLLDLVEIEAGDFGVRILNSWSDSWGEIGMGILQGSKAVPDGAVAPRTTLPSAA